MKKQKLSAILAGILLLALLFIPMFNVQGDPTPDPEIQDDPVLYLPLIIAPPSQPTPQPTPTRVPTIPPSEGTLIIDHTSVELFDRIPEQYKRAAEALVVTFMDRSVGSNISDGLTCLSASTWAASDSSCRRYYTSGSLTDWKTFTTSDASIPEPIQFPGGWNRSNITFLYNQAEWEQDVAFFINSYPSYAANNDIFTFQHNYLHVGLGSTIDENYFNPNYGGTNIVDLLALEASYPNKTFIYWTSSLARIVGTPDAQSFNDQMRDFAREEGKILFDVADIESHAPDGSSCRNAQGYEIICRHYTTETNGGHLGSVSAGKIQIAKAFWVMLARIAGWNGQ